MLANRLWQSFETQGRKDFLVTPENTFSYDDFAMGIHAWLAVFDQAGLVPGDRFIVRTDKAVIGMVAFIAGLVDGVVPVLLDGGCPDARLNGLIAVVEPRLVASDAGLPDLPSGVNGRIIQQPQVKGGLRGLFGRKPSPDFGVDAATTIRAPRLPQSDGLAYLLFTSGTTSAPSGVEISRSNLTANLDTLSRLGRYSDASRMFNDLPLAHTDGITQGPVLAAWNKCAVLRAGGFDVQKVETWLGRIREYRATHVLTVPTVWAIIDRLAAHDDYFDAPECTLLLTTAAKMPQDLWQRIETRFGRPLCNYYGMTETVSCALYAGELPEMGAKYSIGRPVDCEARIADGELQLRGQNIFSGYWRNPERTAANFTADGWFKTGDIAQQIENGSFEILGRLKTIIKSGGVLIRPDEVDEAMLRHPLVEESATIGVSDDIFGEIGITAVTMSASVDEAALTAHMRDFLEPRKVSKRIVVLDEIPRGLSGKIQMEALRAAVLDAAGQGSVPENSDIAPAVLDIAAKVFRVPVSDLSVRSAPDDVPGWDSFTQLNLVLSIEDHFNIRIPASRLTGIHQLGDFVAFLQDAK